MKKLNRIWDFMNARKSRFLQEVHGRANSVAGEAFMDGCSAAEADTIYLKTLPKTFRQVAWAWFLCLLCGHSMEYEETGDVENGPDLEGICTRCGKDAREIS